MPRCGRTRCLRRATGTAVQCGGECCGRWRSCGSESRRRAKYPNNVRSPCGGLLQTVLREIAQTCYSGIDLSRLHRHRPQATPLRVSSCAFRTAGSPSRDRTATPEIRVHHGLEALEEAPRRPEATGHGQPASRRVLCRAIWPRTRVGTAPPSIAPRREDRPADGLPRNCGPQLRRHGSSGTPAA